ncbi:MAG: ABC transporter ATP-binding protein [Acidimicrobiia bacterium]
MTFAIRTEALKKYYGKQRGLDGLDLEVESGEIYCFLGPNGAGKTTAIRLMLDVLRPTSGRVEVLGLEPRASGVELRKRMGYLPGDFVVNGRQTSRQLFNHLAALRGGIDAVYLNHLIERLGLDPTITIRSLSKGNRQKVGLVQAFMHQPELLILDEPTSGLDPMLQREFQAMAKEAIGAGQTVFMSSHVLSEVQDVADRAGIIRDGRLVAVDRVETLREKSVRRVEIVFDDPIPAEAFADIEGVEDPVVEGNNFTCQLRGRPDAFVKAVARYGVASLLSEEQDLEEMFFAYYSEAGHA